MNVFFQVGLVSFFAVDIEDIVFVLDGFARESNDPFNDFFGFSIFCFTSDHDIKTVDRQFIDNEKVFTVCQGWIHRMAIDTDRRPQINTRENNASNNEAEERPFFQERTDWIVWFFWTFHALSFYQFFCFFCIFKMKFGTVVKGLNAIGL